MKNEVRAAVAALMVMCGCNAEVGEVTGTANGVTVKPVDGPAVSGANEPGGGPVVTTGSGGGTEASAGGAEASAGGSASNGGGMEAAAGGAGGAAGGGAPAAIAFTAGPSGCAAMSLDPGVNLGGFVSDRYHWSDSACRPRTAALVRNDVADPGGSYGGYLRELTYQLDGTPVTARGTGVNNWNGWGYVVNHYASSADVSKRHSGTYRTVFAGQHHAIHEFKVRMNPGGPVDATVHWFFASGRSAPVYFITYDATPSGPNVVAADSRAPYGDLAFEGTSGPIGGVAWGDKYRFTTTTGPVSIGTAWDYTQPNVVPYVRMWSQSVDAEMGAVQTQTWATQPSGGDYASGQLRNECWGKTSATKGSGCSETGWNMPTDYLWPYQLNQYEIDSTTSSHRVAWGTTYGAIGRTSYSAWGMTLSGYPTLAYSVFMTLGPKSQSATMAQVAEVERMVLAQVTGAAYDASFGVWKAAMSGNRATVTMNPAGGAVAKPIFRFTGFTGAAPARVTLDGQETSAYFASVDAATQTLWVTLNGTVTGPLSIHVE